MDPNFRSVNGTQTNTTSSTFSVDHLDQFIVDCIAIYLVLVALATPLTLALLGLVAFAFTRVWKTFLRMLLWKCVLAYISWVTTVALFLFTGSAINYVALLVLLVFFGIMRTALVLLVIFTLPVGYVVLHVILYTGIMIFLFLAFLTYLGSLLEREQDAIFAALLLAITIATWMCNWLWEKFWTHGPGAALLAEAEDDWETEEPLLVIIRAEFEEVVDEWPIDGREWWEIFNWNNLFW